MTRPVAVPGITLKPKSLAQQNTDFTSEGAPPPGQAARAIGAVPSAIRNAASRTPANIPGAHRRAPTGKRR
jgi:hypothetical protein